MATPNWPRGGGQGREGKGRLRGKKRTACPITQFATDFHFCREGDDGDADAVPDAGIEGFVDIARVAGGEGAEDDKDLAGGVGREMAPLREG